MIETDDLRYLLVLDDYEELPDVELTELTLSWHRIYEEFSGSAGGNRSELYLAKQKSLIGLKFKHDIDASIIRVLAQHPNDELIELAEECGYSMDKKDLQGSIDRAVAKIKRTKKDIERAQKDMQTDDEKPDFDALVTSLERFQGYQFNEREMTVKKFANIYKAQRDAAKDRS